MTKTHTNNLANASSPYLQQHAHNPVDWYEWGEDALCRAREENKPILISIGYAACHWCHVMAHESFEDSAVAAYMNDHFINIKIDREERPDIDQVYMEAAQLITGRGGWPLNAFALPNGKPFFAGTYFTKSDWMNLLEQVNNIYLKDYGKLEKQAKDITEGIKKHNLKIIDSESPPQFEKQFYKNLFPGWERIIDTNKGGFNRAPKFPLPVSWEFVLQYYYLTGDDKALKAVEITLGEMARGGIYDQIGGGFARYSVDVNWKVPHFEKMLYDNGQLISLYSHAYSINKNPDYAYLIKQTLNFIERELMSPEGGFYSSLDADSEGVEGKFYVWTEDEIDEVLDKQNAELIKEFYLVETEGNWEYGNNILHSEFTKSNFEKKHNLPEGHFSSILEKANKALLAARNKRIRPGTDDKILTSWNALMLTGYIDAYKALGEKNYLETALRNAHFLEKNMIREDGCLWRNYKDGKHSVVAFLDDYALLANSFIHLYQVTFDKHWLDLSKKLADYCLVHFSDFQTKLFFYTSNQTENLIVRKHEVPDNVIPSSNSVMARVLYLLGLYFNKNKYTKRSLNMMKQIQETLSTGGPYYANWGMLYGLVSHEPFEIAIMGNEALARSHELQSNYLPSAIFMGGTDENLSLLENKLVENQTLIYVCKNKVCQLPVNKADQALLQIK